jgi:hypothetical protein
MAFESNSGLYAAEMVRVRVGDDNVTNVGPTETDCRYPGCDRRCAVIESRVDLCDFAIPYE